MPRLLRYLLAVVSSALLFSAVVGGDGAKTAAPEQTRAEIERLIKQLGSDEFSEREAATKALEAIDEPALGALRKAATEGADPEVRRRAERIVAAMDARSYRKLRCFTGHADGINSVAFSPDGRRALSAPGRFCN